MERVIEAINKVLSPDRCELLRSEWESILAAIIAAQPPDKMDEACAALRELSTAQNDRDTSIKLRGDGSGLVKSWWNIELVEWASGDDIPAAIRASIRASIPKPEPTPKEDWETLGKLVEYGSSQAREAFARLRENWEQS